MSEKFAFIDGEVGNYPICRMCQWLAESTSGFYQWRTAAPTAAEHRRAELTVVVRFLFEEHKMRDRYGRIHAEMARCGVSAGPELVRSIMRAEGLVTLHPSLVTRGSRASVKALA